MTSVVLVSTFLLEILNILSNIQTYFKAGVEFEIQEIIYFLNKESTHKQYYSQNIKVVGRSLKEVLMFLFLFSLHKS